MLKTFCLILFLTITNGSFCQKILEKTLDASEIERLVIYANAVFKLSIVSENATEVSIVTKVTGETFENFLVTTSESIKTLTIGTSYTPYFEADNDKLAAHKVLSVEMLLNIPKNLDVVVTSKIASVEASGSYGMLQIALDTGYCELTRFSGDAWLETKDGAITVYTIGLVTGRAISKHGIVTNTLPMDGKHRVIAKSKQGDIGLFQTK